MFGILQKLYFITKTFSSPVKDVANIRAEEIELFETPPDGPPPVPETPSRIPYATPPIPEDEDVEAKLSGK